MLFKSLVMRYREKGHGLCVCSLGVTSYRRMGAALYAVLQLILPPSNNFIRSQIEAVGNDTSNGYKLLWLLQKRYITMFDLTKEPT